MASIQEIYPKLWEALEQFLDDHTEVESKLAELKGEPLTSEKLQQTRREAITRCRGFVEKFRKVTEMDLGEEDIVSMEDLAVACAKSQFWDTNFWTVLYLKNLDGTRIKAHKCLKLCHSEEYLLTSAEFFESCPYEHQSDMEKVAEDLLCLLKPVEEELLPPEGPTDLRIWEIFAAAKVQHRQFSIVAIGFQLPETNELVQATQAKFKGLLSSFQHVQLQMERQGLLGRELSSKMTGFTMRLKSACRGVVRNMTSGKDDRSKATRRWSQLSAAASQIAAQVKELEVTEVNSLGSWSLVSGGGGPIESSEVGSMASGHSVDSQSSCLSGHGGPHCFLPSYLFKSLQADDKLSSKPSVWANAKDWNPSRYSHIDVPQGKMREIAWKTVFMCRVQSTFPNDNVVRKPITENQLRE